MQEFKKRYFDHCGIWTTVRILLIANEVVDEFL